MTQNTTASEPAFEHKVEPCEHLKDHVSAFSDNTLQGPERWYMQFHISICPNCRNAVHELRALEDRMKQLNKGVNGPPLTEDRRTAVEQAMNEAEAEGRPPA